jgi:hypothetical protein
VERGSFGIDLSPPPGLAFHPFNREEVDVSTRTLLLSAGLLAVACGAASSQPAPPLPPTPSPPGFSPPAPPPAEFAKPTPPPEKAVEELLNELERVQAQKAELEKKEQELKATIRKRLEKQAERLNKLGVTPKDAKAAEPDRITAIVLEGHAKKEEKKIRDALGLVPGQVLDDPALEAARVRLEKAGFRGVKIEVAPNCYVPTLKDIVVKVEEPKP